MWWFFLAVVRRICNTVCMETLAFHPETEHQTGNLDWVLDQLSEHGIDRKVQLDLMDKILRHNTSSYNADEFRVTKVEDDVFLLNFIDSPRRAA